jgi:hypothetical protein
MEQGLIKWSHMPESLAMTWEPLEQLHQEFPRAPTWGHAGSQEGGNVSTVTRQTTDNAEASEADPMPEVGARSAWEQWPSRCVCVAKSGCNRKST